MRILIVGSDANAYSIAKIMSENKSVDVVFSAPYSEKFNEFAHSVDISETDNAELLDFVIANEISLTIVTSPAALENDIAGCFGDSRQLIFAPCADSAVITLYRSLAKKLMYRLKIPTMKFGIFERENQATEYAANARKPLVIKKDLNTMEETSQIAVSFPKAKQIIEKSYTSPGNKLVIEDYIDGKEVTLYFLTDGYTALPIGSCMNKDGFVVAPDGYISEEFEGKILKEVVYPIIDDIAAKMTAYCGILGVDLIVDGEKYNVTEFQPFFRQIHLQSILPLLKSDLNDLFLSAASGSLSDEYSYIDFNAYTAVSKIYPEKNVEFVYDDKDFSFAKTNFGNIILTQRARTLSRAKANFEQNITENSGVVND